ncbi:MAG: M20/M25/M40 family metallo-hydrolase [Deferribacteres bacterium]|nr:M20/M25/M40 family metallo-hydrolase [candidate division KSB1 bacterium]MCB9503661.1 M20/M25/M40 family metallo-hydrolase [Deferribacteres bacterium]
MTIAEYLKKLINIPSLTGEENQLCTELVKDLTGLGFQTRLEEISTHRFNLHASVNGKPKILLSSHMDTVPPFIPASENAGKIFGRGANDAKGQIAAMLYAVKDLPDEARNQVGLLFVVGEETDSIGAKTAVENGLTADYVINGEPTDNVCVSGHKGIFIFDLHASGTAAHSGYPEQGDSAIHKLVEQLYRLQKLDWGMDDFFGVATFNAGTIEGGLAANVLAPSAKARCFVRVVTSTEDVVQRLDNAKLSGVSYEIYNLAEPVRLFVPENMPAKIVKYASDASRFAKVAKTMMLGPGSILNAHTKDEFISIAELQDAVQIYQDLIRRLLEE